MKNRNDKIKIDPDFWDKVQNFDGSNIPKSDQNVLWDITNIFSGPNWHPFKKNK